MHICHEKRDAKDIPKFVYFLLLLYLLHLSNTKTFLNFTAIGFCKVSAEHFKQHKQLPLMTSTNAMVN